MKNAIIYYYNLTPECFAIKDKDTYSFYIDYEKFYLKKLKRPKEDLDEIMKIVSTYSSNFHKIILNRDMSPLTIIDETPYVLIKINGPENDEVDIQNIIMHIPYNETTILDRTSWGTLWSEKIDYLEYQVSELATKKEIIRSSFSYYVGLAENAIEYFNMLGKIDLPHVVSHKRIDNLTSLNFYDPLDIVVDYRVRDIASYLKTKFFQDNKDILKEVDIMISKSNLTNLEYNLLFARLLYPSYYFDELYRVLEKDTSEETLLKYIDHIDDYEQFLKTIFAKFIKNSSMIKIDWLIEEH